MGNPITSMIHSTMKTSTMRQEELEDRVAKTAIFSQQLADERHGPALPHNFWQKDRSSEKVFNRYYTAHSALKGKVAGRPNSYEAHGYYTDLGMAKRDALLAEIAAEEGK